ncbi:MAG: YfiM family protein [Bacteroidales bacterium]|nr:YfiM family protein [Bacteroidales bacterium]
MQKNKIIFLLFLVIIRSLNLFSQETVGSDSLSNDKINIPGVVAVGSITPLALAGVYVYMNNAWWNEKSTGFHFDDGKDLIYAKNLDKLGHYTASLMVSNAFSDILRVANVPENWALFGGATLSVLNATVIEIKDGYAPYWGFSIYDELANVLGAFYPVLQAKVPFFKNINFKWSFDLDYSYETEYYKYKVATEHEEAYSFIDDYDRQYFWMTVDWANIFCKNKPKNKFPYCIDFAIGASANNLKTLDPDKKICQELYVGFDLNLTKLFQRKNWGYYVCKYLNFYHLPMPGMQIAPKPKVSYPLLMY